MKIQHLKSLPALPGIAFSLLIIVGCNSNNKANYSGTPYEDSVYQGGAQTIPGKLQSEYYDQGGEGVAFHDSDSVNSRSHQSTTHHTTLLNKKKTNSMWAGPSQASGPSTPFR